MSQATTSRHRPTFDRFIVAVESAAKMNAHAEHTLTDDGLKSALECLREAEPVARAVALLGNPLHDCSEAVTVFCRRKRDEAKAAARDPQDTECDERAAEDDALYFTGLALGLILADSL